MEGKNRNKTALYKLGRGPESDTMLQEFTFPTKLDLSPVYLSQDTWCVALRALASAKPSREVTMMSV